MSDETKTGADKCDVAVLGGGPAGCATALRLRRHDPDLSVTVVEATGFEEERIGETLPPIIRPLLEGLGVWERFQAEEHVETYGTVSLWGTEVPGGDDFITSPFGRGWHLDRRRFDAMLATEAADRGTRVLTHTRLTAGERHGNRWQLELEGSSGTSRLDASFVADATGRRAVFARRQGARRKPDDQMVGVYGFFRLPSQGSFDTQLLLEPVEGGWWYSTRVPGGRGVAVLMTDSDLVRHYRLRSGPRWSAALETTRHTRERMAGAVLEGPPQLVSASSGHLDPPAGDGWLAVGDAASTFDPLSGQGILKSLRGGSCAAYAISDHLRGKPDAMLKYRSYVEQEFESYLATRASFYALERRWPASPFWRRRHRASGPEDHELLDPAVRRPEHIGS